MNYFTRRDIVLKEPMREWLDTEACSIGSTPHRLVRKDETISYLY